MTNIENPTMPYIDDLEVVREVTDFRGGFEDHVEYVYEEAVAEDEGEGLPGEDVARKVFAVPTGSVFDTGLEQASAVSNPIHGATPVGAVGNECVSAGSLSAVTDETDETAGLCVSSEIDSTEESHLVPDGRPVIKLQGGELPEVLRRAEELLRNTGKFFCSGKQIVVIQKDAITGDALIAPATAARLSVVLSEAAAWLMPTGRNGELRRVDVPDRYCAKLLKQEQFDRLKPLAGIARQPFLRSNGSVCREAGYDTDTGLYGVFAAPEFPILERPTRDDAEAALNRLDGLLDEFPFVGEQDRSAAIAAMLTAVVRPSLPLAPMFLVTAPEAGTGKTFLCHVIAALSSPRIAAPQTFPRSEEEVDKILIAELRSSPPVVFFDNLNSDIQAFQKLCVVLTTERASGRILGSSSIATVSTRTLILASGNNVKPARDMQRRCITINLDPRQERPASRAFKVPDLHAMVLRMRGEFVADALTIVRAWIADGSPISMCPPLVSFDAWSKWCRQPLLWLGRADPAQSAFAAMEEDPDRMLLRCLLAEWTKTCGSGPVMVRDLIAASASHPEGANLRDILADISDQGETLNRRRIGRWIARHAGQIAAGLRIESAPRWANAEAWKVASV